MNFDGIKILIQKTANKIVHFIKKRFFDIMALILSGFAVWISIITLDKSIEQFQQNAKSSDSLFNVQLKNSQELNDSLISQIKGLQEITNKQLEITDQQLKISTETYREQLYSKRPKIIIQDESISDTTLYIDDKYSPVITISYKNIGVRNAVKFKNRNFLVYADFSGIRWNNPNFTDSTMIIEPERIYEDKFKPKIVKKFKYNFYYCIEIRYTDEELNKEFLQYYYLKYQKNRADYDFFICTTSQEIQLKKFINNELKLNDFPVLEE